MDQERRKIKRTKVKVSACCLEKKSLRCKADHIALHTKDISSRGAHLIVSEKMNKNEQFLIGLHLPAMFAPLSFQCEVVWVGKRDSDSLDHYETGIRFVKVDPYDIGRLERFLRLRDVPEQEKASQR